MKISEFFKKHKKRIIKTAILVILLLIAFLILNMIATAQREYTAVGGEVFVFFLPFLIVACRDSFNKLIDTFKK